MVFTASDLSDQNLPLASVAQFEHDWRRSLGELATLPSTSRHLIVERAQRRFHTTYAGDISEAIRKVIDGVRTSHPLPASHGGTHSDSDTSDCLFLPGLIEKGSATCNQQG
jgi:hypothetical protein